MAICEFDVGISICQFPHWPLLNLCTLSLTSILQCSLIYHTCGVDVVDILCSAVGKVGVN